MLLMTRSDPSSKVVLVEQRRENAGDRGPTPLRRYRLARLRLEGRSPNRVSRFEHLKRSYD
jgi:hypothetical protein